MKIEDLLRDDDFVRDLEAAEEDSDVIALFNRNGIAVTEEEVKAIRSEYSGAELSEENLEEVAGGRINVIVPRPLSPKNPIVEWLVRKLLGRK